VNKCCWTDEAMRHSDKESRRLTIRRHYYHCRYCITFQSGIFRSSRNLDIILSMRDQIGDVHPGGIDIFETNLKPLIHENKAFNDVSLYNTGSFVIRSGVTSWERVCQITSVGFGIPTVREWGRRNVGRQMVFRSESRFTDVFFSFWRPPSHPWIVECYHVDVAC
jgi:hypothetical protein